jgi:hypothetical protein
VSSMDFLNEDEWYGKYAAHFLKDVLPMLDSSDFSISIAPTKASKASKGDVKYWTELGASIMYDKPIIAIVEIDADIPERLRRVADVIVEADLTTDEGRQKVQEQIAVAIAKLEESSQ